MKTAAIDIGNSTIKLAVFQGEENLKIFRFNTMEEMNKQLKEEKTSNIIVSSVRQGKIEIEQDFLLLDRTTALPIKISYDTPDTLGLDRIAAAAGAHFHSPNQNKLIIDAGTCITYDIVTNDGVFEGGIIAPGLKTRLDSMHTFTQKLPLIAQPDYEKTSFPGKSTRECMINGAYLGLTEEIKGMIVLFEQKYGDLQILICGGDYKLFESKLKGYIFALPELVLVGLNRILLHNVSKLQ